MQVEERSASVMIQIRVPLGGEDAETLLNGELVFGCISGANGAPVAGLVASQEFRAGLATGRQRFQRSGRSDDTP